MDTTQVVLLCAGVAVVAAAASGIPLFFAGISHRKKTAEAEIGSAEEQAKKVIMLMARKVRASQNRIAANGSRRRLQG